jgi:ATP-dependent DNA helicase RecG
MRRPAEPAAGTVRSASAGVQRSGVADSLLNLKGVGPALVEKLARLEVHGIDDLLFLLPLRYEDHRALSSIAHLQAGEEQSLQVRVVHCGEVSGGRGRKRFEALVQDASGQARLVWFHYRSAWLPKLVQPGRELLVHGVARRFAGQVELLHPQIEAADQPFVPRILPVYPLTEGISQAQMRRLCQQAVALQADRLQSHLPATLRQTRQLLSLASAIRQLHQPDPASDLDALQHQCSPAHRTLIYEEFFYLQLGLGLRRRGQCALPGRAFQVSHRYTRALVALLPFKMTTAQRRVLGEIKRDLMAPAPMQRLLQGDVGSGKTLVALMAALVAIENACQAAVVAPTEILAEQHYRQFVFYLQQLGLRCALLTGSTRAKERRTLLQQLQDGQIHLLVGTHALFQPEVQFADLGLVVIDEQHRFGVQQRNLLRKKGRQPDVLVMTATPIPRTLSMTLYGDLALSVIDELPAGRQPIRTRIVCENKREQLYSFIEEKLRQGRQAYCVYPLVEESQKLDLTAATDACELLQRRFSLFRLALLHGQLPSAEKDQVMRRFQAGDIDLLVATTVIEVGIDVPNASLMMIEHAERFGLAQLHQLRGRVGRGKYQSYCFLLPSPGCGAEARQRLQVIETHSDGFRIAEADLQLRGPGEFLGTRQAGLDQLRVANLLRDQPLLELARQDAFDFLAEHDILQPQFLPLRQRLQQLWGQRLELANVG